MVTPPKYFQGGNDPLTRPWSSPLVSEMTYYVSSGTLNPTHSLTHLHHSGHFVFMKIRIN